MCTVEEQGPNLPDEHYAVHVPSKTVSIEETFDRAGSLHAQDELDQAEQLYCAILQSDPNHIGALHNLGILRLQRGQYDDTIALVQKVVRLKPGLPLAHNTLGVALRQRGRLEEAEGCCREALRLHPDYAEAHNNLGWVLTALGRLGEAEGCCREALRLQPDYAEARNNLGLVLANLGRLDEAELCFREVLRLKPADVAAHNNLGSVLADLGRLDEAEICSREVLRLQPGNPEALRILKRYLESKGYVIARADDYYSPLVSLSRLRSTSERWNRPSALRGIDYDIEYMKLEFSNLLSHYLAEFSTIPDYATLQQVGFGPGYTAIDALTLYMMVRHLKPRRYVEIGSGLSTYYCSLAAERNSKESHPVEITCIEPNPYPKLRTISGINVLQKEAQDIEISLFQQLEQNDILFIDSSHILKIDGDVPFLYLEVLPSLNAGVMIHIHDIPFPYNIPYPPQLWVFSQEWPMLWNEAMVLQTFLCFNEKFKITMSTPLIRYYDEGFLKAKIPFYETLEQNANTFSSIWLKRL
jgi:Flp pilus assembly protein TadD